MERIDKATRGPASLIARFQRASGQPPPPGRAADAGPGLVLPVGAALAAQTERFADQVEISDEACRLAELRQTLLGAREAYDALEEGQRGVDRLELVRGRVASGFYASGEVRAKVAERLTAILRALGGL